MMTDSSGIKFANQLLQILDHQNMKDDLLILKLLKVPVTIIKYLSKFVAMFTYLPNYLIILVLDALIFSTTLSSSLSYYAISWPFRFVALVGVVVIFCAEFFGLYMLLSISHFHWAIQLVLTFIAFQGVLALMRHGYLTMIKKYSPTKLKSPYEHLQQISYMLKDIVGLLLTAINAILLINITRTLNYNYSPNIPNNYLKHITKLIHVSILDIIKLFYIKIFFRFFPWRYLHSQEDVRKEEDNILQLVVLLTLLFWLTIVDLIFFVLFGIYCAFIHPRKRIYRKNISQSHEKFKVTAKFLFNTIVEIFEIVILLFCMPLKFKYSKQLLGLICARQNDYSFHYLTQTFFVLKLALVKLPSLVCELILLIFFYKFKKIAYLIRLRNEKYHTEPDGNIKQIKLFTNKFHYKQAAPTEQQKTLKKQVPKTPQQISRETRHQQREYIVFRCFGSLLKQILFLPLIPVCTILKLWNIFWLRFLVDQSHDLRVAYIVGYFVKIFRDYVDLIPALLLTIILGFYDPVKAVSTLKKLFKKRKQLKSEIPKLNQDCTPENLKFYDSQSAILPRLMRQSFTQIKKDILFLPLFVATRLSLFSLMGCAHPKDSVELFEYIWMLFYMKRVKRSAYFEQYLKYLKTDQAAGMIKNSRERLRFWKFAHKSVRHRLITRLLSLLLPKYRADKAIANAKVETNYSAIANHYWHCYNTNISLLQYFIAFVIEIIITLFGIVVLLPLTLWRMPTFVILFRIHKYKKKMFFKILFTMYAQMLRDIFQLFIKIPTFILFPRAYLSFRSKTAFRYTSQGVQEFASIQRLKIRYIIQNILVAGLELYALLWKICFVKILWIRKRDMNLQLKSQDIRLSIYVKDFLLTRQSTPTINELIQTYGSTMYFKNKGQLNTNSNYIQNTKITDINIRGDKITRIVDPYVRQTIQDIPYLLLMVFLLWTLPWRFYYIKNALFMMRDDKIYRKQFLRILKLISKDYQCIFLYILLVISIVKTRRAFTLFYRNAKLNFYIGTLKYSHLKQLRGQLLEAGHFYKSVVILILGCMFGPYRIRQTYTTVKGYYIRVRQEQQQRKTNQRIYENTVKQGKSLELITSIGNNTLMQVFTFLNARQLTVMTRVSKYMYDTIKERDQVWIQQWQRVYEPRYPGFKMFNQLGSPSYNSMCVQKFKDENSDIVADQKDRFYKICLREFRLSAFETELDLKEELRKILPTPTFEKIFRSLRWTQHDGYGPEQNWPQPTDNEQFLDMFNIVRRQTVQLNQPQATLSWLFERPIEFFITRFSRFYNRDTHRKKKQILYALFNVIVPILWLTILIFSWSWFWEINMFIGYKVLGAAYVIFFFAIGYQRYTSQARRWVALNPFDIVDDVIAFFNAVKDWVSQQSTKAADWTKDRFDKYVQRPIRWVGRKISHYSRLFARKVAYTTNLFIQKVAKPLYIKITHHILALIQLIKDVYRAFVRTIGRILRFIGNILKNIYNFLFEIVKSVSKFYATFLEQSLRLALSFGNLGELIFTIIVIFGMVSPSIICYYYYFERWFIIFSTLLSMVLMVTGYKHLNRMKEKVLMNK